MIVLVETVSLFFVLVLVDFDADATDKKKKEKAQWVVKDIKGKHTNKGRRSKFFEILSKLSLSRLLNSLDFGYPSAVLSFEGFHLL